MFAERTGGGYFLDFDWKRDELARYGLTIDDAQAVVQSAIGGENVTTTVEGRERYPVNVRYMRDFRRTSTRSAACWCRRRAASGRFRSASSPTIKVATGPAMIRNENGMLTGYVYVDVAGRDLGSYVEEADAAGPRAGEAAAGLRIAWSGQYRGDGSACASG